MLECSKNSFVSENIEKYIIVQMDKTKDSGTWLKFFKDAGIPTKTGASYAHIFVENRISKDMLSDLTVDHLRLMGITLIGDVIAILRHAKSVHQDSLRKVVILKSKDDLASSSSSSSSSSSQSSSSSSDSDQDVEMLEYPEPRKGEQFVWSEDKKALQSKVKKESSSTVEEPRKQVRSKVINNSSTASTIRSNAVSERKTLTQHLKRRHNDKEPTSEDDGYFAKKRLGKETNVSAGSGRSMLRRPQEDTTLDAPLTKSLSTENKLMGPKLPPPKKTVFDRLGAETGIPQVSSTTEVAKPELETRFTRTIGSVTLPTDKVKIVANIDIPPPKSSSVFNRLGDVTSESSPNPVLPYAGVLKYPPTVTRPTVNFTKKVITMRADEPEVPVKLRAAKRPTIQRNVRQRAVETSVKVNQRPKLIRKGLTNNRFLNPDSEGIFANPKNALQLSAKDRIGLHSQKSITNKSAKARLGVQTNSGRTMSTTAAQRFKRPVQARRMIADEDEFQVTPRNGALANKKVSFGGVIKRLITPMRSSRGGRNTRGGIHNRLGRGRFT